MQQPLGLALSLGRQCNDPGVLTDIIGYGAKPRVSTASEPFILIADAVHHWDENGLFSNQTTSTLPPQPVADTQKMEAMFVQEWMEEWKEHCLIHGGCS